MNKTEQIIEDCPHFMYGCCQKYLDGDCSTHKCDLKIIRELQQEVQETKDNYVNLDLSRVKEYNELVDKYKAKEQECEELKSDLTDLSKIIDCKNGTILTFKEQLDQLKTENEKLKKQVCGLRPELKYIIDKTCSKYNIEAKYYHEKIVEIINNLNKLSKILIEIKEIARVNSINTCWTAINLCEDCNEIKECGLQSPFEKLKAILQKISECEVRE